MRLKRHQISVPLHKGVHQIISVLIEDLNGLLYPLSQVTPDQMQELQKRGDPEGLPIHWCFQDRSLLIHPRPDKDYEKLRVRYTSPPKLLGDEIQELETEPSETSFGRKANTWNDR